MKPKTMTKGQLKEGYLDFDEYIRQGEPSQREAAYAWSTAIGLQAVDGLKTSEYLNELARRNIEGEITIDEARELIKTYYQSKAIREPDDDEKHEADIVSGNITKLILEKSFTYSVAGIISIHRHIFEGVFKHAGKLRTYDITKKEWVLRGDTVLYGRWQDLRMALEYDLEQERQFDYRGLDMSEVVEHLAKFVSGIWQIHPFCEGNTRTTAVFTIKYLRSIGFDVTNDLFNKYSWYFRNALVRANYRNVEKGISHEPLFLIRFFRNLLMGERNELRNRYMIVNPPKEWQLSTSTGQAQDKYRTSTGQIQDINPNIEKLLNVIGEHQLSVKQIMEGLKLKGRDNFLNLYLAPAVKTGFVKLLYPNSPRHPRQKYLLTVKGQSLLNELTKGK